MQPADSAEGIPHLPPHDVPPPAQEVTSAWAPLRRRVFRALWIATVVANIGMWMQNVGAVWLMASLSTSPFLVALVQTATSLPFLLFALPAGALADVVDRRKLLLVANAWMLGAAAVLGLLTQLGLVTPWSLLLFTFAFGVGFAANGPAFQAIMPELVDPAEIPAAVGLNAAGFNVSRAVGPALGGLAVALAGSAAVFFLNAVSIVGILVAIYRWRRATTAAETATEHVMEAARAGVRYVRFASALRVVLIHTAVFMLGASGLWAMLPVVARDDLGLGAAGYGVLLGCIGAGSVGAAALLPKIRPKIPIDPLVGGATVVYALTTVALGYLRPASAVAVAMLVGGVAWFAVMSSLMVATQMTLPAWVRGRGLALLMLVIQGGLAVGSAVWGAVADRVGVAPSLLLSAAALVVGLAAVARKRLTVAEGLDTAPSRHFPHAAVAWEPEPEDGPILVEIEYRIDPRRAHEFARAMRAVGRIRRRDGAVRWGVWCDTTDPSRYVETFVVESWAEHLRQHARATVADREVEERARSYHVASRPPKGTHYLFARGAQLKAHPFHRLVERRPRLRDREEREAAAPDGSL